MVPLRATMVAISTTVEVAMSRMVLVDSDFSHKRNEVNFIEKIV
jgi:hypothetical protein